MTGEYTTGPPLTTVSYSFNLKDLRVADAPQTQVAYSVSLYPIEDLLVQAVGRTYDRHYSEFNPVDWTRANDSAQSWRAPGYTVFDLNASYRLLNLIPAWRGGDVRLFAHVFNVLDAVYVQDAVDNSAFNGFPPLEHKADDAEVFLGIPRTINMGFELAF